MIVKFHFFNETIKFNTYHLPEDIEQVIAPFVEEAETIVLEADEQELENHTFKLVASLHQLYVQFLVITRKFKAR